MAKLTLVTDKKHLDSVAWARAYTYTNTLLLDVELEEIDARKSLHRFFPWGKRRIHRANAIRKVINQMRNFLLQIHTPEGFTNGQ